MSDEFLKDYTLRLIDDVVQDLKRHLDSLAYILEMRMRAKYESEKP